MDTALPKTVRSSVAKHVQMDMLQAQAVAMGIATATGKPIHFPAWLMIDFRFPHLRV